MGYQLLKPDTGQPVNYDDCQHSTGIMIEAKGEYAGVLSFEKGEENLKAEWLEQSGRQIAAAGGRRIRWYFAEPETAAFAKKIFKEAQSGREDIEIVVQPWPGNKR